MRKLLTIICILAPISGVFSKVVLAYPALSGLSIDVTYTVTYGGEKGLQSDTTYHVKINNQSNSSLTNIKVKDSKDQRLLKSAASLAKGSTLTFDFNSKELSTSIENLLSVQAEANGTTYEVKSISLHQAKLDETQNPSQKPGKKPDPGSIGNYGQELCPDGKVSFYGINDIPCNNPMAFSGWFLGQALKVAGLAAILLIVWGGYTIMVSRGNPDNVNKGKGLITNALVGLIFIIFSAMILRFIVNTLLGVT